MLVLSIMLDMLSKYIYFSKIHVNPPSLIELALKNLKVHEKRS